MKKINRRRLIERKLKTEERIIVYGKFNYRCAYCGTELKYKNMCIDHFIPIFNYMPGSNFDVNHIDNLMPSCSQCNHYKSNRTIEAFRESIYSKFDALKQSNDYYIMAGKYGLIKETGIKIEFYFEKIKRQNIIQNNSESQLSKEEKYKDLMSALIKLL